MVVMETTKVGEAKELTLLKSDIEDIKELLIKTLKNELPQEAHTVETFDYILEDTKRALRNKQLKLE